MDLNQIETNPNVDSLLNRINSLNNVFDQAEKVCASEIVEFIEEKQQEVELFTEQITPSKVIELDFLISDFKFTRETLRETVENGRKIINTLTLELLDIDDDARASMITSFAELVTSVNQSVKLLSQSYKDISSVLETIEKVRKSQLSGPQKEQSVAGHNNTFINITTQESTTDIIQRLRNKKIDG